MFKKFVIATLIAFIGTSAFAMEPLKYDFLNLYKPGGVFYKVKENIEANATQWSGKTVNVGNCAEAVNYLSQTDRPTIVAWDIYEGLTNNDACAFVDQENFLTYYGNTYFRICGHADRPENDLHKFITDPDAKVGAYSSLPLMTKATQIVKGMKSNATVIPYDQSSQYMAALEIGEIDFIMTSRWEQENLQCILSGDPMDDSLPRTINYYKGPWSTPDYGIAILGVNIEPADMERLKFDIIATTESELWNSGATDGYTNHIAKLPRKDQYLIVRGLISSYQKAVK